VCDERGGIASHLQQRCELERGGAVELAHDGLRGLAGADVGTGNNEIEIQLKHLHPPRNLSHLLHPLRRERAVGVRFPGEPPGFLGDPVPENIDLHSC
jgi:hypothetical protein